MKGCRPFTDEEITALLNVFANNQHPTRDRALFLLGIRSGFRISEILSLTLGDVVQNGSFVQDVAVARRHMKKKREGRSIPLHAEAREALALWVGELQAKGNTNSDTFLFQSREGTNRPLDRRTVWHAIRKACAQCGMTGKIGTHSLRKTFARRMKAAVKNDLHKLQKLMGHAEITSTMRYIELDEEDLREAVLS